MKIDVDSNDEVANVCYVNSPTLDILFGRVCGVFNDRDEGSDNVRLHRGVCSLKKLVSSKEFLELHESRILIPDVK